MTREDAQALINKYGNHGSLVIQFFAEAGIGPREGALVLSYIIGYALRNGNVTQEEHDAMVELAGTVVERHQAEDKVLN